MLVEFPTGKFITTIISQLGKYAGNTIFEKFKLRRKLKKIKGFKREYDDTEIDTYAFQSFLDLEETQLLVFDYLFSSKFTNTSKQDMVTSMAIMAKDHINEIYAAQDRSLKSDELLIDYFDYLLNELVNFRDQELSGSEKSIVASIQNSIIESNNALKKYIENKFERIENYTLAKHLTDEKLDELLHRSINSLGARYNPQSNVETNSKSVFRSLLFDDGLKESIKNNKDAIVNGLDNVNSLLRSIKCSQFQEFEKETVFFESINSHKKILVHFDSFNKLMYRKEHFSKLMDSYVELRNMISDFKYETRKFEFDSQIQENVDMLIDLIRDGYNFLYRIIPQLINHPYLVINGEGGIGKSHLLADIAEEKRKDGHIVFLFLGQHFTSRQQPFQQMFDFLEYKGDSDSFLSELSARAARKNKKTLIFIDALNEGQGKYFWKDYIVDFIAKVKKYQNIALVMSNRSNFMKSIFPEGFFKENLVSLHNHRGFYDLTLEALKPFFDYYKVNPLIVPSLQNECRNPLFLKMYCEVATQKDFNQSKGWSITEVLSLYIDKVNFKLSNDERFPFVEKINIVKEVTDNIADKMIESNVHILSINKVQEIISNVAKKYTEGYRIFLNGLLEENLLTISEDYQGQENVYFSYERFYDIIVAQRLIIKVASAESLIGLDKIDVFYQPNIYEALSIVAPEELGEELFGILERETIELNILHIEAFIRGLSWRKINSINDKTIFYIEKSMEIDRNINDLVYDQLIMLSYSENSMLNADYLHKHLSNLTLAERDSKWTIYINNRPEILERIFELTKYDHQKSIEEVAKLLSTTITWLFTSSNRLLRDKATHTLVTLLKDNMGITQHLLEIFDFKDIDDPYVLERLYAAVYGASVRTDQTSFLSDVCDFIFASVFRKDEVYPHALLRDYARGILLYCRHKGIYDIEEIDNITPPFRSQWYSDTPTLEEIDSYKNKYSKYGAKSHSVSAILSSMTTEYGRGIGAYGDFGRYVFQSALRDWANQFNVQDLSNIATKRVFELGYDVVIHGEHDLMNGRYFDRHNNTSERIGKKYQWIAFHELLARLSDNFPIYTEEKEYTREYREHMENYHKELMKFFQNEKSEDESEVILPELELDSESHITNIKRIKKKYNGTWEPFIRDIDPTILISEKLKQDKWLINFQLPKNINTNWIEAKLNDSKQMFEVDYEGKSYISLATLFVNKRKNGSDYKDRDELAIKSKAIFVNKEKAEDKRRILQERRDRGIYWMESYQIYAFEHFWHPAHQDKINEYIKDSDSSLKIEDAVWDYIWESNYNYESEDRSSISYLLPNKSLVDFFKLTQKSEGIWVDDTDSMIAFDASMFGFESCLLFEKSKLHEYLSYHEFVIYWKVYEEKVSNRHFHEWWSLYSFENGKYSYEILHEDSGKLNY